MTTIQRRPEDLIRELPTYVLTLAQRDQHGRYRSCKLMRLNVDRRCGDVITETSRLRHQDGSPPLYFVDTWQRPSWHRRIWRFLTGRCR